MLARKVAHRGTAPNADLVQNSSDPWIRRADPELHLDILVAHLGQREYFADRLSRQKCGNGVLLTAWLGDRPVGGAYLWLEEAEELELRTYLPGVPLLTHVEILPEFRGRGIGTKLIEKAARTLAECGHERVALAVDVTNMRARSLYERLGYRLWRHPSVPHVRCYDPFDDSGGSPEICHVMVKDLR